MEECGEKEHAALKEIISPREQELSAFYPGAGNDLAGCIDCTGASKVIALEKKSFESIWPGLKKELERAGAHFVMRHWNEVRFEYNGKPRAAVFHEGNAEEPGEWPKEVLNGFDVYFEKRMPEIIPREAYARAYSLVKLGGFVLQDTPLLGKLPPEKAGFEKIETGIRKKFGLSQAGPCLYKKIKKEKNLAAVMQADKAAVYG